MQGHDPTQPYCIYESLQEIADGWSMRCLIGQQLRDRREFIPAPDEDGDAVLARAHAAGEAWCVANGGQPAKAPSSIDGWVQGMVRTQSELRKNPTRHYELSKLGF